MRNTKLKVIDLFAGAGGLSLAAQKAGVHVLAAVENATHACESYKTNLVKGKAEPPKLYRRDILRFPPKKIIDDLSLKAGELDILMGGPPCQGYSSHRLKDSGVGDPRNKLLLRYFAFVRALLPKAFIVENVPGILWPRHATYLARFKRCAEISGYDISAPTMINARDYGVPQNRKRIFLLGCRHDLRLRVVWPPSATHFAPNSPQVRIEGQPAWETAASVFSLPIRQDDKNAIHMRHSEALIRAFESTPLNGGSRKDSGRILECHRDHNGHKDVYGRIDPSMPGPTMTTACINPSKGRFVHPTENHGITLRHAARFQSFPESFEFHGGLIAGGVQVGNAVPILLGIAVLKVIIAAIEGIPAARSTS